MTMGAGEWASHHAITRLMYRYAECVDAADFEGIGTLFARGQLTTRGLPGAIVGADAVRDLYAGTNKVHPDGTLLTRHLTTNVIVDIDEDGGTATARSSFVVFQATPSVPLQPVVAGRYRDRFARIDGAWWFAEREMGVEQVGDVSDHLLIDLGKFTTPGG
jgi:3-phenylpropionate/cinnamic acid dioxygenase small subunit